MSTETGSPIPLTERTSAPELKMKDQETRDAMSTSVGALVAEGFKAVKENPDAKGIEAGSPEDMRHALGVLAGFQGGKDKQEHSITLPLAGGDEKKPYKLPKVTYKKENGQIVLGIVPADGKISQGLATADIVVVMDRKDGHYLINFGDGKDADGNPFEPTWMHEQDLQLVFAMTHADAITSGINPDTATVCKETFGALAGSGKLPDKGKVERVSGLLPKMQKFDAKSHLVTTIQEQQRAEEARLRQEAESQVPKTTTKEITEADGSKKTIEEARDPKDIEKDIEEIINGKLRQIPIEQRPSSLAALAERLTKNEIQNPEDLTRAFQVLYATELDKQIGDLEKELDEARSHEAEEARFAQGAQDSELRASYESKQKEWKEVRERIRTQIEALKNFRENKDAIAENFFRKSQNCELSQEDVKAAQEAMASGKMEDLVKIMAKSSGVELNPKALEHLDKDKRELLMKLLSIGGPLLYVVLQILMSEINKK